MSDITRRGFLGAAGSLAGASALGIPALDEQAQIQLEPSTTTPDTSAPMRDAHGTGRAAGGATVTLAVTEYLRFTPLIWGQIQTGPGQARAGGLQLRWVRGTRREMLDRTLDDPTVDGGEASMLGHLVRVARGDRSMVAVPVFLLRNFTARDLYVLQGSELNPRELSGRRLGIYNWAASGAVWYRRLLRYLGNDPASMRWVVGNADAPGTVTSRAPLPPYVRNAPPDRSLTDLITAGEIDALFAPLPPAAYHRNEGPLVRWKTRSC
jgi:4,5-dihydroxyphthalate decarboxylase